MNKTLLITIFLQSFPETLIFLSIGLTLIGYEIKENIKKIAIIALIFSVISYVINSFQVFAGLNTIIQIPILVILVMLILKQKLRSASLVILVGITILILFEGINVSIFDQVLGISYAQISADPVLKIIVPYVHFTALTILIYFLKKKNVTILPLLYRFKSKKQNYNIWLAFILIILSLLTIIVYISLFVVNNGRISYREEIRFLTVLIFIFLLFVAYLVKKLINTTESQITNETQKIYLKNLNELHNSFRALRHDFANQVHILNALINNDEIDEAKKYIESLGQNINLLSKAIRVNNPVITALLQTKAALAETSGVNFIIDIQTNFNYIQTTDLELARLLGNLLDNAFEATAELPTEKRIVKLIARDESNFLNIEVYNTGNPVPVELINEIFNSGISTKKDGHSGLGLTIVKKIIHKYKGNIGIKSDEGETVLTVILPITKKKGL